MHFGSKIRYTASTGYGTGGPDLHPVPAPVLRPALSHTRLRKPPVLSSHPRPFDPDELTRRLYVVLDEQQAYADRKRRSRAAGEAEKEARHAAHAHAHAHAHARADARPDARPDAASPPREPRERRAGIPLLKVQTGEPAAPSRRPPGGPTAAAAADAPAAAYHHVPQVAASQFARTTTVESLSDRAQASKLSRKSLSFHHHDHDHQDYPRDPTDAARADRIRALRRTQSLRERTSDRTALRPAQELAATAEADEPPPTQPLTTENLHGFAKLRHADRGDDAGSRRKSMGDVFHRIVAALEPPERSSPSPNMSPISPSDAKARLSHHETVVDPDEHRVDWTQSDELAGKSKPGGKSSKPPAAANAPQTLRRADSKWALTARLAGLGKSKGDRQASPVADKEKEKERERDQEKDKDKDKDGEPAVASPKSPSRLGIFARFKR